MRRLMFLALILAVLPLAASAQALIIGGGAGKDCFNAVKLNPFPTAFHEKKCSEAILSGSLDRKNLAATLINRGIIRMRRGNFVESLEDYARAEALTPDVGALHLNKGAALIGTGQYAEALASLEKSLALETQDPEAAYYNIGVAHERLGQVEPAYRNYQTALELKPNWSLPSNALERFTILRD